MLSYTIIIPVKSINNFVRENVEHIQKIYSHSWELIILPNHEEANEWHDERIKIISTGRVGPADKRDIGAKIASGQILVFLDDDSYPEKNILAIAERYFHNSEIVAVGGPAITPMQNSFWQQVSGAVFLSALSGGNPERYRPIGADRFIDDWPSVNFMVRREEFLNVGGFNSPYWPGEDTKLCLDLIQKTGKKIMYIPALQVWHHRRSSLIAHLKQVGGYGLHRGYFAKKYPQTSRKLRYFLPSAFVLFTIVSLFSWSFPYPLQQIIILGWCIYGIALVFSLFTIYRYTTFAIALASILLIFLTHISYGLRFIQGVFTKKLISKLR